jgi:hypothetical protein
MCLWVIGSNQCPLAGMSLIMSSRLLKEGTTLIHYGPMAKLFNRLLVRLQSVVGSRERVIAYRQIERVVFE